MCQAGNPNGPGAQTNGPWIHGNTWNRTQKVAVTGNKSWPQANFTVQVNADTRTIKTDGLPVETVTGNFPIAPSDPAYQYDRNPNSIAKSPTTVELPVSPEPSAKPSCTSGGAIGVLLNGVYLFNGVDATGRDAVAYEEQDVCQGHPQQQSTYHYHDIPTCLMDNAKGPSTVVGWAYDGYPIVVERDAENNLPTNADLDECHGRTSPVVIDGEMVTTYHYSATIEFPFTIGCFHAPSKMQAQRPPG